MTRSLRVLTEYPGVGRPHDIIDADSIPNPQALVDAGIVEWTEGEIYVGRRALIETTERTPVRETTIARTTRRKNPSTGGNP